MTDVKEFGDVVGNVMLRATSSRMTGLMVGHGGSVMVWGGISLLANCSLIAVRYRDKILRAILRPYAGEVGPGFLLVHDNPQPPVARVAVGTNAFPRPKSN